MNKRKAEKVLSGVALQQQDLITTITNLSLNANPTFKKIMRKEKRKRNKLKRKRIIKKIEKALCLKPDVLADYGNFKKWNKKALVSFLEFIKHNYPKTLEKLLIEELNWLSGN